MKKIKEKEIKEIKLNIILETGHHSKEELSIWSELSDDLVSKKKLSDNQNKKTEQISTINEDCKAVIIITKINKCMDCNAIIEQYYKRCRKCHLRVYHNYFSEFDKKHPMNFSS